MSSTSMTPTMFKTPTGTLKKTKSDLVSTTKNNNGLKTTNLLSLLNQYNKHCLVDGQSLLTMERYLALCNESSL